MINPIETGLARSMTKIALAMGVTVSLSTQAATFTVAPVDTNGNPVTGFRYLVEEDTTYKPTIGLQDDFSSLSFGFHRSHNPVAQNDGAGISGETDAASQIISVPDNGHYFVSVLPYAGHSLGGAPVSVTTGDSGTVEVRVNNNPIPTAQISIQIFEDNNPVNGAIDQGERGLTSAEVAGQDLKFHVILEDPAGQYGAGGGRLAYDAYGNPLGTDYSGMDADGNPVVSSYPEGFDTNGTILNPGLVNQGVPLVPDDDGYLVIKHLPPGKYGVIVVPPQGWHQTSTIEGSKVIDAWVKANEPESFVEFGPPGPHVFVGFVRDFDCLNGTYPTGDGVTAAENPCLGANVTTGTASISGEIVNNHMSRPPEFSFHPGAPFPGCRIAVNQGLAGRTIYSGACFDDEDAGLLSAFEVNSLAAGDYSLSIWDDAKDVVIANHPFTIAGNDLDGYSVTALNVPAAGSDVNGAAPNTAVCTDGNCDLGTIPVFNWFTRLYTNVFHDMDEDGFWDANETALGADSSATFLRWRDGRLYKEFPIDAEGAAPYDEVFPFFHWLVAEVDFGTFKATGATWTVDNGGGNDDTSNADNDLSGNDYIGQPQTDNGAALPGCDDSPDVDVCTADGGFSRTERGEVLTAAFQGFLGQKSVIDFGKTNYGEDENGGISGMVVYAITRAEHDVRYAATEVWEPGIPRVQVALYQADPTQENEAVLDINGIPGIQAPDVDNYPLNWFGVEGGVPGPEDIDHNDDGIFDYGDAIDVTWTDSWDDSQPTDCQGSNNYSTAPELDNLCFDGMRNWNQIRPGVFDGGFAFPSNPVPTAPMVVGADGGEYLDAAYYIVQSYAPPGYELVKPEDKNVDFGDAFAVPQLLPPICVGEDHTVPQFMSFATAPGAPETLLASIQDGADEADFYAPYYDPASPADRFVTPLCDTKQVLLTDGKNAAVEFHYFTEVPKAAHVVGGILNDLANEFNPDSPAFGEKFAPPWLPVAFYDWAGNEVTRVYSDQYGKFNAMLPSTYTVNQASPSGVSPNMLTACMNDGGFVPDPNNPDRMIVDPNYNPQYTQFCYTFQYMPGGTTYLDTPVLQLAAFANAGLQLDCEAAHGTPMIHSVVADGYVGPYLDLDDGNPEVLTITSVGVRDNVLNPASNEYDQKFISRDYGFGDDTGFVFLENEAGIQLNLQINSWTDGVIVAELSLDPVDDADTIAFLNAARTRDRRFQLTVENALGVQSPMGVSVVVGDLALSGSDVIEVTADQGPAAIQDAIDLATYGDLILVGEGVYNEMVILYKPVYLQGAGASSTVINARAVPFEKTEQWKTRINELYAAGQFALLPEQAVGPLMFDTEEGPGLMVVAGNTGINRFNNSGRSSGVDGFTLTGASTGGGILVNGYVRGFDISNNLITGNEGTYGGGIRFGHYALTTDDGDYVDAVNRSNQIHHNMITKNGALNGTGGGIALYDGSNNYRVTENLVCGNFAATDGAGIGHLGLSSGGQIEDNKIIFNQSFRQTPGFETDGGGILIAGKDALGAAGDIITGLSTGTGHVVINRNLIQGNQAGAGDGAGIALRRVNGVDLLDDPDTETVDESLVPNRWWRVRIFNNTIVNNVAGLAGGAISVKDSVRVDIINNTMANNMSTATAGAAFTAANPEVSVPQIAGIASYQHQTLGNVHADWTSPDLEFNARYGKNYSNPLMRSNILWHNQSQHFELQNQAIGQSVLVADGFSDLGVVNNPGAALDQTRYTTVSDVTLLPVGSGGYNLTGWDISDEDPLFVHPYEYDINSALDPNQVEFKTVMAAPALDEGGNWIDVRFAPLSINDVELANGSYSHPGDTSTGIDEPSDYRLQTTPVLSPAVDASNTRWTRPGDNLDIELEDGTVGGSVDRGSDEVQDEEVL